VGRGLAPEVLKLFACGGAPQYLVAVGVTPEARYHVVSPFGLRDPELGHRPQVWRRVGRFLLLVADDPILEV
jgi:hypothetical protein